MSSLIHRSIVKQDIQIGKYEFINQSVKNLVARQACAYILNLSVNHLAGDSQASMRLLIDWSIIWLPGLTLTRIRFLINRSRDTFVLGKLVLTASIKGSDQSSIQQVIGQDRFQQARTAWQRFLIDRSIIQQAIGKQEFINRSVNHLAARVDTHSFIN